MKRKRSENENDNRSSEDEEDEEENEEEIEAAVLSRARRSTAGRRMSSLVGKSFENDNTFWSHSTWNEEKSNKPSDDNDADISSDDGSFNIEDEEPAKDAFDSDFNDSESDSDEEISSNQNDIEELDRTSKARNRYNEPKYMSKKRSGANDASKRKSGIRKRGSKGRIGEGDGDNAGLVLNFAGFTNASTSTVHQRNKKKGMEENISHETIPKPQPSTIDSEKTKRPISSSVSLSGANKNLARIRSLKSSSPRSLDQKPAVGKNNKLFSQEELLVEAANITEAENERWLLGRKRLQKQNALHEKLKKSLNGTGSTTKVVEKFHSRRGFFNTLTFTNMDSVPVILRKKQTFKEYPSNREKKICIITGNPAQYRDPKTNKYYSDLAAFKELRRRLDAGIPLNGKEKISRGETIEKESPKIALNVETKEDNNTIHNHEIGDCSVVDVEEKKSQEATVKEEMNHHSKTNGLKNKEENNDGKVDGKSTLSDKITTQSKNSIEKETKVVESEMKNTKESSSCSSSIHNSKTKVPPNPKTDPLNGKSVNSKSQNSREKTEGPSNDQKKAPSKAKNNCTNPSVKDTKQKKKEKETEEINKSSKDSVCKTENKKSKSVSTSPRKKSSTNSQSLQRAKQINSLTPDTTNITNDSLDKKNEKLPLHQKGLDLEKNNNNATPVSKEKSTNKKSSKSTGDKVKIEKQTKDPADPCASGEKKNPSNLLKRKDRPKSKVENKSEKEVESESKKSKLKKTKTANTAKASSDRDKKDTSDLNGKIQQLHMKKNTKVASTHLSPSLNPKFPLQHVGSPIIQMSNNLSPSLLSTMANSPLSASLQRTALAQTFMNTQPQHQLPSSLLQEQYRNQMLLQQNPMLLPTLNPYSHHYHYPSHHPTDPSHHLFMLQQQQQQLVNQSNSAALVQQRLELQQQHFLQQTQYLSPYSNTNGVIESNLSQKSSPKKALDKTKPGEKKP